MTEQVHNTDIDADEIELAKILLGLWRNGRSKSSLEIEYWGDGTSHGKRFTGFIKKYLHVETEVKAKQSTEIDRLVNLLRRNGIATSDTQPLTNQERLVAKSREAALSAIRIYNDPTSGFRSESFAVLMMIAWNCLFQAILESRQLDYYERDDKNKIVEFDGRARFKGTWELCLLALPNSSDLDVRSNIDFFLKLRHLVEHRFVPLWTP